jgi:hypothetical protein
MPDVEYRNTAEFKGLDGQSEPDPELLKGVFKQARFDTRFYEVVQEYGDSASTGAKSLSLRTRGGLGLTGEQDPRTCCARRHSSPHRAKTKTLTNGIVKNTCTCSANALASDDPGGLKSSMQRYSTNSRGANQRYLNTWLCTNSTGSSFQCRSWEARRRRSGPRGLWGI